MAGEVLYNSREHQIDELHFALERAVDSRSWHLILLPTERCNFRCTYCYETFENGRMSAETVLAVKQLISRRLPELNSLTIDWFGGEPLLEPAIIRDISEFVLNRKSRYAEYKSNMTTNGYLLDKGLLSELISLGISQFQISIDGWSGLHDVTRRRVDGAGTFDRILSNLVSAKSTKHDFLMTLRLHLMPSNVKSLPELLDRIEDEFGKDDRFRVHVKSIGRYGGANDKNIETYWKTEQVAAIRDLRSRVSSKNGVGKYSVGGAHICYASKPNSLVIRSNGKLAKCTVAMNSDKNNVGTLLPNGKLQFKKEVLDRWFEGFRTLEAVDLSCPWYRIGREKT